MGKDGECDLGSSGKQCERDRRNRALTTHSLLSAPLFGPLALKSLIFELRYAFNAVFLFTSGATPIKLSAFLKLKGYNWRTAFLGLIAPSPVL